MTILIAHRGNVSGAYPDRENQIDYLETAVEGGFDVEIDAWYIDKQWFFGHDAPTIKVDITDVSRLAESAWFHAKNYYALRELTNLGHHAFAHDKDPFVVTSKGWIWSHNGLFNPSGIVVMPSLTTEKHLITTCAGVCHDDLLSIKYLLIDNVSR